MRLEILIAGWGSVGKAIGSIVASAGHNVHILDPSKGYKNPDAGIVDVLHIAFPCGADGKGIFIESCLEILKLFRPDLTIIESTVPVGTTEDLALMSDWPIVHSPCRGLHNQLEKAIRTFIKYIGGDPEPAREAINYYSTLGLKPYHAGPAKTTELLKLLSTAYFGWSLLFVKAAKEYADLYGVEFDQIYSHANMSYNDGYLALGHPEFIRPILTPPPSPIGGKCVTQNIGLLEHSDFRQAFEALNDSDISFLLEEIGETIPSASREEEDKE